MMEDYLLVLAMCFESSVSVSEDGLHWELHRAKQQFSDDVGRVRA